MLNETLVVSILKEKGILDDKKLRELEIIALKENKSLVDVFVETGLIDYVTLRDLLAQKFFMDTVDVEKMHLPKEVVKMLSPYHAHKYRVLPVEYTEGVLKVAIADPMKLDVVDTLSVLLGVEIEPVLATEKGIEEGLKKYYGYYFESQKPKHQEVIYEEREEIQKEAEEEVPVIRLVSLIISEAIRRRASDIHIEPMAHRCRIRYRVDGVLYEVESPPKRLQNSIISRIKIMANMSIDEKRLPQDGRIKLKVSGRDIDLRVSTLPSNHGESIVMRILDRANLLLGLSQLGLLAEDEKKFKELISRPNGIILVTGPTGSGKTTTLYACLNYLNKPDRKIITVEDPIEYLISGINQVQVNEDIGLTFAAVLRSILRQAPDIVMVGEIRDLETANIAIHASLTGHLVFSTLHTNDAPSAITRLIDQGVKPFLVASAVEGVIAQRLVRVICPECKEEYIPPETLIKRMGLEGKEMRFWRGKGCSYCRGTGYCGRTAIFEILLIDDELRKLIHKKISSTRIRERARQLGMKSLPEDGLMKVSAGITTLEEVMKVAWEEEVIIT